MTELKKQAPQGFGQAMNDFNKQQARQQNIGAVKDMASKVGTGAKDMASKVGTGVKDMATKAGTGAKQFATNMANKVGDVVRQRGANQAGQQLGQALTRKAGGDIGSKGFAQAMNQFTKQGAKQAGKQALKQGAKGLLGRAAGTLAGPPAAIATALTPSQIGGGENDSEQKFIKEQMARSNRAREMKGQKPGEYVLQNAPEGSRRQAQEKFNAGVDQALGLKGEQKAAAPQKQKKQQYGIKNPYSSDAISNAKTFGEAFKAARKEIGAGGVFEYGGKKYNTFTRDEMKSGKTAKDDKLGAGRTIGKDNIYQKDWAKRKDFTGSQNAPASERGYYTNKSKEAAPVKKEAAPAEKPSGQKKPDLSMEAFDKFRNSPEGYVNRRKAAKEDRGFAKQNQIRERLGEKPMTREQYDAARSREREEAIGQRKATPSDAEVAERYRDWYEGKTDRSDMREGMKAVEDYNARIQEAKDRVFGGGKFGFKSPGGIGATARLGTTGTGKRDYGYTRPSRDLLRSENSSIEKLKKHMEKQKTSKKEGV
jgi:hypothetical protein